MFSAHKYNYHYMPQSFKLKGGFDEERQLIFKNILKSLKKFQLSSSKNWFPLTNLVNQFKEVYYLTNPERQELVEILIKRVFYDKEVKSAGGLQNAFSLISQLINFKQKFFDDFQLDYRIFYDFMELHVLTNRNQCIVSQSFQTSMLLQFYQLVKKLSYFFDKSAIDFAFTKFKENLGSSDKQLAWSYLTMFTPFRTDIPSECYDDVIKYVEEAENFDNGEKENCRLRYILNYMRTYPDKPRSKELVSELLKAMHGFLREDANSEEQGKNLANVLLPDDCLDVDSVYKMIPRILIEMIGSSKRPGYNEYMQQLKRIFSLFDSIMSVYNIQTWDNSIFKIIKMLVCSFIYKYRRDLFIKQISELQKISQYDESVADQLFDEMIQQFNDMDIQDSSDSDIYFKELCCINPDQGYLSFSLKYPDPNQKQPQKFHLNHKMLKKEYFRVDRLDLIDEQAKDDFIQLVLDVLGKVIFMEDPGLSVAKTALYLSHLEPKTIDFFLKRIDISFNNPQEISLVTVKSILIFLTLPILQNKNDYHLKDLFKYMEITFNLFETRGVQDNIDSLEFYDRIMLQCSCYTPEEYLKRFPEASESDAVKFCEFMSNFLFDLFDFCIKNLNQIKYRENESGSILINLSNLFWPMICNSSDSIVKSITEKILVHIENDLDNQQFGPLSDILDCLAFRAPQRILIDVVDLVYDKLLRDRLNPLQPHYFNFLIDNHPKKELIISKEPAVINIQTKKLWLSLLEKTLTQAGSAIRLVEDKILVILLNYIREEESELFEVCCDILHTVVFTPSIVRPKEFQSHNQFYRKDFTAKRQEDPCKSLDIQWKLPDQDDWDFIFRWLDIFLFQVKEQFTKEYFQNITMRCNNQFFRVLLVPQDFETLADVLVFSTPSSEPKLKQICYRFWFLIFGCFSGVSLHTPLSTQDLDMDEKLNQIHIELYEKIQKPYFTQTSHPKLEKLRPELGIFVEQAIVFSIQRRIAVDREIHNLLVYMSVETVCSNVLTQEISQAREYLGGARYLSMVAGNKIYFDTRMELIADIQQHIYQRHLLFQHLQAAPRYFISIYYYILLLVISHQADFTSPQYLLPYSSFTTSALVKDIRSVFVDYLIKVFDFNNPKSLTHEKQKGYKQLQEILKAFYNSCENISPDLGLPFELLQKYHSLIKVIDHLDNKQCKQLLTDGLIKSFVLSYDEGIFKNDQRAEDRIPMMWESANALQSNQFWKCKLLHTLFLLNCFNLLEGQIPNNLFTQILTGFKILCVSDHVNMNQLGRSGIFYLMRFCKKKIYKKEDLPVPKDQKLGSLERFLKWRFVTPQQEQLLMNTEENNVFYRMKNADLTLLAPGFVTKVTRTLHDDFIIQSLRQLFTDQEWVGVFLRKITIDKDVLINNEFAPHDTTEGEHQEVQLLNARGVVKLIQIMITYIYAKDKKKQSPFSCTQSFFMSDFYCRFFKKIFQVCGIDFFNSSRNFIEQYASMLDSKEEQRLVSFWLGGLCRSLLQVKNYPQEMLTRVLPHISQECFADYHIALYYICKNQDWYRIQPFMNTLLECCKRFSDDTGVRGFRYIHLLKILIQTQVTRSCELQSEVFRYFKLIQSTKNSSAHIDEIISLLSLFLLLTVCFPLPKEALMLIEPRPNNLVKITPNFYFNDDEQVKNFFGEMNEILQDNLSKQEEEVQRVQQEISTKLLEYIYMHRVNKVTWLYIKTALQTVFENHKSEIDTMEIIRKQVGAYYEPEVEQQLTEIVLKKAQSDNWQTRKKANYFLRDWYFFKLLKNENKGIDVPEELLIFRDDKHPQLQQQALHSLSDYFKLYTEYELNQLFASLDMKDDSLVLFVSMAMLISRQDRTFEWTDEALSRIQKLYVKIPAKRKLIQSFVGEYWKTRQDSYQIFQYQISAINQNWLREIVNPYSYFA